MALLEYPTHDSEIILEYPYYWDTHESSIDYQIWIVEQINAGDYTWLEKISKFYSPISQLLFDKLYCADYHHVHKVIIAGEDTGSMNQDVINEFFKINFKDESFSYEDLEIKIREDILNSIKEYTLHLEEETIRSFAYTNISDYLSGHETRYWLMITDDQEFADLTLLPAERYISIRRAEQLEKELMRVVEFNSFFLMPDYLKEKNKINIHTQSLTGITADLYLINISKDEYFNKQIQTV